MDAGEEDAIGFIQAIFGKARFGGDDPGFLRVQVHHTEVSEVDARLWHEHLLRLAQYTQLFKVHLRNEERGTMTKDVVVVRAASGVDKIKSVTVCHPVLLGIVAAEHLAVVIPPLDDGFVIDAILAARHEGRLVCAHGDEVAAVNTSH